MSSLTLLGTDSEFYIAIKTLHNAAGKGLFGPKPVEDEGLVFVHRAHELFGRFEARTHGAGALLFQIPMSPVGALVMPQQMKALLEQIGTHAFQIVLVHVFEASALGGREIARIFSGNSIWSL